MCKGQSMEASYIELHHAFVMIAHECEGCLAEEIAKDRAPMLSALEAALGLMEASGEVVFCGGGADE